MKNDRQLIKDYQNGDIEAFNELYKRYNKKLHWYIYKRIGSNLIAEDLVQETFIRLARFAYQYDPQEGAKFSTWFYTVARNVCTSHYKYTTASSRDGIERSIDDDDEDWPLKQRLADKSPEPDRVVDGKMRLEMVRKKLEEINSNFAQAVILRDIEGYTYEEMSDILGVPVGTVKSRIYRGRDIITHYYGY